MREIRIDFISDRRWRWVWALALLSAACFAGIYARQWHKSSKAAQDTENLISVAKESLALLSAPKEVPLNPKRLSAEQAAKLLQQDLNKAFATIEKLKEPGARLRSLNFDGASGVLRLEFEIDSVANAAALTAVLNAGYDTRPWQLEAVSGAAANNTMGFATAQAMRGLWFAELGKL